MAEALTRKGLKAEQFVKQNDSARGRMRTTIARAQKNRRFLAGELRAPLPKKFSEIVGGNVDAFAPESPAQYTTPLHMLSTLERKRPRIKRPVSGASSRAQKVSTTIEQCLNAIMDIRYPWAETCDLIPQEGLAGVGVVIDKADWLKFPDLYEDDDSGETKIKPEYQRDSEGKTVDDYEDESEFVVDHAASASEYRDQKLCYYAENLPIRYRPFSVEHAVPIWGPDCVLEGMISCTKFQANSLMRRGYRWGKGSQLSPVGGGDSTSGSSTWSGSYDTAGEEVDLYEWWFYDSDGHPCIAYSVNGDRTYMGPEGYQQRGDAMVIDLYDEYGIKRLPLAWRFGISWKTTNPDRRSIPFSLPFMRGALAAQAMATGVTIHTWWRGFSTIFVERSQDVIARTNADGDEPEPMTIEPLSVIEVDGKVTEFGASHVSSDAFQLMDRMLGANRDEGPPPAGLSGGQGESGISQTVARRFLEDSHSQLETALLELYEEAASFTLEALDALTKKYKRPLEFNVATDVPSAQTGQQSPTSTRLELPIGISGTSFGVKAEFPVEPGDNLARMQAFHGYYKDGSILFREWREWGCGDPSPEITKALMLIEQWEFSDQGKMELLKDAMELMGDQKGKEMFEAQQAGQAAGDGTPMGMLAGLQPGMQGGGAPGGGGPGPLAPMGPGTGALSPAGAGAPMPGMTMGNPVASQLAAISGAAQRNDAAAAGIV